MQRLPKTAGRVRRSEAPLRKTEVCNASISDPPLFVGHPPKCGGPTSGARDALSGMMHQHRNAKRSSPHRASMILRPWLALISNTFTLRFFRTTVPTTLLYHHGTREDWIIFGFDHACNYKEAYGLSPRHLPPISNRTCTRSV
jgi:hypothetical protein